DEKGKVVWRSEPRRHAVLDPGVAFLITDVLAESVLSGTADTIQQTGLKAPAAGKTGTTNEGADAWFVGYTPEIAAGVWIGFDKPRPILDKATGGQLAAPVWGRMLARVYQNRPAPRPWTSPADVIPHWVDPPTGLVIKVGCAPQHGFARPELFLKGIEPAAYCPGKEAPPANPFPTDRRLFQRNQEEREAERRAAEQRAQAEREAKQKEQERLARLEREKERQEQARLAEIAREEQRKKERLAAARKAAESEKERAALKAREERIAREEAEASRREAEIAAREHEKDRRAKEAAAREEARLQRLREQRNDEGSDQIAVGESSGPDLSGWWELTNTIASTNYAAYRGLRLTYRLQLEQDGDHLTGRGQKWAEEGAPVSAAARSPISVTGRIEGNKVILQFTERGAKRSTTGSFAWTLAPNGNALRGTFWSTAADTSGGSVARRLR
ncbi:MAG TPA: hypothetical protein VIJ02_13705, partial [Thermoanaerobaculia bacterium]